MDKNPKNTDNRKEVIKTWIAGQRSCTLVIPKGVAKEYGLDRPSHAVLERMHNGILIRKLQL